MIYVIEGLDRCGKTTFSTYLRNFIKNDKIIAIHSAKPPKGVDNYEWTIKYYNNLINVCLNLNEQGFDIILDRSWLGEMVYGPLYRNTNIELSQLENSIKNNIDQFKLFLFIDSVENVLSRDDGLSHSINVTNKLYEIESFKTAFDSSLINSKYVFDWSIIDFSDCFLKKCAAEIIDYGVINANNFEHTRSVNI